jgi:3-hydroxybutyryl-CoA dehydrogenase
MTIKTIAVVGAGTMGSGIAQVCAQNGFEVMLFDIDNTGLEKGKASIEKSLQFLIDKQKISIDEGQAALKRLNFISNIEECKADLVIEAIVEKTEAKVSVFNQLAEINSKETIFATNTSSLSVSELQSKVTEPHRVVGMHFFNPATLMKLVEVVKGKDTSDYIAQKVFELCGQLKKTAVMCEDAPGFIVNRVARHYYLESMKLVEQGMATFENVDEIMEASGFKMGPFKLMDLIGMDVNLAVSQSLYDAFHQEERFRPNQLQKEKVSEGKLGKKTGEGFYKY